MTSKELLYVEDALSHAQFLKTQAETAAGQLTDPQLKAKCQELAVKNQNTFSQLISLV